MQELPATFGDLMGTKGKAELINCKIVSFGARGYLPGRLAKRIVRALEEHVVPLMGGEVFTGNVGYTIDPPLSSGRQSICPDASFYTGTLPANPMSFLDGFPVFAVEVRSENDYGSTPDREYAAKRADYFEAGTVVVWDVDPVAETVTVYTSANPLTPTIFRRGNVADAEPAVPGWRLSVDALFA